MGLRGCMADGRVGKFLKDCRNSGDGVCWDEFVVA